MTFLEGHRKIRACLKITKLNFQTRSDRLVISVAAEMYVYFPRVNIISRDFRDFCSTSSSRIISSPAVPLTQ